MHHKEDQQSALYALPNAPAARLWDAVRAREADRAIVAVYTSSCEEPFQVMDYLHARGLSDDVLDGTSVEPDQHCHAVIKTERTLDFTEQYLLGEQPSTHAHAGPKAAPHQVVKELQNGVTEFVYEQTQFRMYVFSILVHRETERLHVLTWDKNGVKDAGQRLIAHVRAWSSQLREEMWVYNGVMGGWRKNKNFYKSVQAADAAELILPPKTVTQLVRDTTTFFRSEAKYAKLNITWKRGILLLGPPGNGKTGIIKVLAKQCSALGIPALYVQTAKTNIGPERGMTAIFQKARREAPCMLILEDIESLVSGDMRTMMLNQLDGVESNHGVLIIATANDASKLDPAILQRPSRFDAKYQFGLPDDELRARFIRQWIETKVGASRIAYGGSINGGDHGAPATTTPHTPPKSLEELIRVLVDQTKDWSFAFLKELFMSLILAHAIDDDDDGLAESKLDVSEILQQVETLQVQVNSADEPVKEVDSKEKEDES